MQNGAEYFAIEWRAHVRISRVTQSQNATDIQELNVVAGLERRWQVTRVAPQGFAVTESSDDDIALVDRGHAARCQLELVVARLVVEDAHGDKHTFLARDVPRQSQFVPEVAVLRN